jgi:protein-tyrosine phosphatase
LEETDKPGIGRLSRDLQVSQSLPERLKKSIKSAAKKLLPKGAVQEVQKYRTYESHERPIYLKVRISSGLGLGLSRPPKTARSFVFVCFGNIMRSPMCEALMNRAVGDFSDSITVMSAGLNATPGRPPHPWAIMAAREFGISLENHRARLLTSEMVDQADAIFAMDFQNQVQLLSRWARSRKKVFMLSAYAGSEYRAVEIPDPYYAGQEETRHCYQLLKTCVENLADSLPHKAQSVFPTSDTHLAKP